MNAHKVWLCLLGAASLLSQCRPDEPVPETTYAHFQSEAGKAFYFLGPKMDKNQVSQRVIDLAIRDAKKSGVDLRFQFASQPDATRCVNYVFGIEGSFDVFWIYRASDARTLVEKFKFYFGA